MSNWVGVKHLPATLIWQVLAAWFWIYPPLPTQDSIGKWRFYRDTWWPKKWNTRTLKLTAKAPENRPGPQEERIVFQASVFRCDLLVSGRVNIIHFLSISYKLIRSSCDRDVFNASRKNPSWCKVYGVFAGWPPLLFHYWSYCMMIVRQGCEGWCCSRQGLLMVEVLRSPLWGWY